MAIACVSRHEAVTTVLAGASKVEQIEDNVAMLKNLDLTEEELGIIETILAG